MTTKLHRQGFVNCLFQGHCSPRGPGRGEGCLVKLSAYDGYIAVIFDLVRILQANNTIFIQSFRGPKQTGRLLQLSCVSGHPGQPDQTISDTPFVPQFLAQGQAFLKVGRCLPDVTLTAL